MTFSRQLDPEISVRLNAEDSEHPTRSYASLRPLSSSPFLYIFVIPFFVVVPPPKDELSLNFFTIKFYWIKFYHKFC